MTTAFRTQTGLAAALGFLTALLHVLAYPLSGFDSAQIPMVMIGLGWAGIAWLCMQNWRWTQYFIFLIALISALLTYMALGAEQGILRLVMTMIALSELGVALLMFLIVWRTRPIRA